MELASREIIQEFVSEVKENLGDRVVKALLYGSYARGDHVPGSDIDVLFILEDIEEEDRGKVEEIQNKFLERGYLFSPKLVEEEEFEEKLEEGYIYHESVAEEGVEI